MLRLRRAEHRKFRKGSKNSPQACEALVFVIGTTCDHCRVASWLLTPHRLALTVELEPQLSVSEVADLLSRFLHGRGMDAAATAEAASALCATVDSARGAA